MVLSARRVLSFNIRLFFITEILSPVKVDSSTCRLVHSIILASAGTLSPLLKTNISPGTISSESIIFIFPSLNTLHFIFNNFDKASADFKALVS